MDDIYRIGIDIGSKTVKLVVLDSDDKVVYDAYQRHGSEIADRLGDMVKLASWKIGPDRPVKIMFSGSAGLGVAERTGARFVQEVVADRVFLRRFYPDVDVAIELGGEDSKILFLSGGEELRMNTTCAGGTGGFIDTIASMIGTDAAGLGRLAYGYQTIYPIASRCAVFAQNDVRPLINRGVSRSDIAASTLHAVAIQCITGLACGRSIHGKVALLGGPLHFLGALRYQFQKVLGLNPKDIVCPADAHQSVATGAALSLTRDDDCTSLSDLSMRLACAGSQDMERTDELPPLFETDAEMTSFKELHSKLRIPRTGPGGYEGPVYLGIDSGSTSLKCVLIDDSGRIVCSYYHRNAGDLLVASKKMFAEVAAQIPTGYDGKPMVQLRHCTVTGYGEDFFKAAFKVDSGVVETVAHARAAKNLVEDVDFILDIGGQDIKAIWMRDGDIDEIVINEACSSGCGALLSGMAHGLHLSPERFVKAALDSRHPEDLGTRCTVFMTSRVRHAQKERTPICDLAAGLSYSVARNALFKVLRLHDVDELGENIMVQGGTFRNDAVLRAFETILGRTVSRPVDSELMGAWGAALIARSRAGGSAKPSRLRSWTEIASLESRRRSRICDLCSNHCQLSEQSFSPEGRKLGTDGCHTESEGQEADADARRLQSGSLEADADARRLQPERREPGSDEQDQSTWLVTGNRCPRGAGRSDAPRSCNLVSWRYERLFKRYSRSEGIPSEGTVGIPRALRAFEDYPFFQALFSELGFKVALSEPTTAETLRGGIESVPSESVCYPAKLAHGHVASLVREGVTRIFMPRTARDLNSLRRAHNVCPLRSDYPAAIVLNMEAVRDGSISLSTPLLPGVVELMDMGAVSAARLFDSVWEDFGTSVDDGRFEAAFEIACREQERYRTDMQAIVERELARMRDEGRRGVIIGMHPYHCDPQICHGIPRYLQEQGLSVFSSADVDALMSTDVFASGSADVDACVSVGAAGLSDDHAADEGSWTSLLEQTRAARYASSTDDLDYLQIRSFGCGIDALAADRTRTITRGAGHVFADLKIDEMADMSALVIRLRSFVAAGELREEHQTPVKQAWCASAAQGVPACSRPRETSTICLAWSATDADLMEGFCELSVTEPCGTEPSGTEPSVTELCGTEPYGYVLGRDDTQRGLRHMNNDLCFPMVIACGGAHACTRRGDVGSIVLPIECIDCPGDDLRQLVVESLRADGRGDVQVLTRADALFGAAETFDGDGTLPHACTDLETFAGQVVVSDALSSLACLGRLTTGNRDAAHQLISRFLARSASMDPEDAGDLIESAVDALRRLRPPGQDASSAMRRYPKVSVLGTAPVVFSNTINDGIIGHIEQEGCEAVIPTHAEYLAYLACERARAGDARADRFVSAIGMWQRRVDDALADAGIDERDRPVTFRELDGHRDDLIDDLVPGAGWLSAARAICLAQRGIQDHVMVQSFACLTSHISDKAAMKELRRRYPGLDIASLEFDPGTSQVNQYNRLKLVCALARDRFPALIGNI